MYNNGFGFNNPYYQPLMSTNGQQFGGQQNTMATQNTTQMATQLPRQVLNGKLVDSFETAKIMEIPLDGSTSYFPLADNSMIVTKQLQNDGTSKITIFKPVIEEKDENKYITQEDMKKALDSLDFNELDDIKEDIKDIKQEIKDLKKSKKRDD